MPIIIGGALTVGGSIAKALQRAKANRQLREAQKNMPKFTPQAGFAKTLLNAKMPGYTQAERNIFQNIQNQVANTQRSAANINQLLLGGAKATEMGTQAFNQLQQQDLADYQRRYQNAMAAQQYDDAQKMAEFQRNLDIEGAIAQNRAANAGDVANLGMAGLNFGLYAGMKPSSMFKGMFDSKTTKANAPETEANVGGLNMFGRSPYAGTSMTAGGQVRTSPDQPMFYVTNSYDPRNFQGATPFQQMYNNLQAANSLSNFNPLLF